MKIEKFISQCEGQWKSMRSGHSLTFQQFEQIISRIQIKILDNNDSRVLDLLNSQRKLNSYFISPFMMQWEAQSDWDEEEEIENKSGSCLLIPIPSSEKEGVMLRSIGYSEAIESVSNYSFLNDGTFILKTKYLNTLSIERIWFISDNVRCRSSVIYTAKSLGVLQTSFASEMRILQKNDEA